MENLSNELVPLLKILATEGTAHTKTLTRLVEIIETMCERMGAVEAELTTIRRILENLPA